jgi:hypothetical protein
MEYHGALYGTYSPEVPILDGEEEGEESDVFALPSASNCTCVRRVVSKP